MWLISVTIKQHKGGHDPETGPSATEIKEEQKVYCSEGSHILPARPFGEGMLVGR